MAETWAKVAAMPPKAGAKTAKGGTPAKGGKPATAGMALPPPKGGAMPLTPAPLSAGLGRSAPVPAAAPGANMMATPAAPSADSNSAAPPVSAPAATASTTAAPSQPSVTDSAATGTQPAQQSDPSGSTGQFQFFPPPPPPAPMFGTPVLTCMICGQNMKGGFQALLAHQTTSSRCRARQGLQGPCSGRSPCPHGCGRSVAHQDAWALAQHERFCTAFKSQGQSNTTDQSETQDHLLPAAARHRSASVSWPRQRWQEDDNDDNFNRRRSRWRNRGDRWEGNDDCSQWDREPRWRTNDDQESYQRWDYSDRNYSNYWSADQRWDDDRSSYWHRDSSLNDDWYARGWRDY